MLIISRQHGAVLVRGAHLHLNARTQIQTVLELGSAAEGCFPEAKISR
jgi:hypothetical protein